MDFEQIVKTINTGWIGGWVAILVTLLGFWKGSQRFIPAVIDAITKRNEALSRGFDDQIKRLETQLKEAAERHSAQLAEADVRHEVCVQETESLRKSVHQAQELYLQMRKDYVSLEVQVKQFGLSAVHVLPGSILSDNIRAATESSIAHLDDATKS